MKTVHFLVPDEEGIVSCEKLKAGVAFDGDFFKTHCVLCGLYHGQGNSGSVVSCIYDSGDINPFKRLVGSKYPKRKKLKFLVKKKQEAL